jgi:hypothetical protein
MTWTKLGAEFADAAAELSDAAFRTHIEALTYSNRRLLDLVIRKRELRRFAETTDPDSAAAELVTAGWWQDIGEAWFIGVHFADWQRDKVQVVNRRQQNAEAQRRSRRHKLGDHELCLESSACRKEAPSPSSADSSRESPPDPERNRTEQNSFEGEHDEEVSEPTDAAAPAPVLAQLPLPAWTECTGCREFTRTPDASGRCRRCA